MMRSSGLSQLERRSPNISLSFLISTDSSFLVVVWVSTLNSRIDSISSPKNSMRIGWESWAGKKSRIPPRRANCPRWKIWGCSSKLRSVSQAMSSSGEIPWPTCKVSSVSLIETRGGAGDCQEALERTTGSAGDCAIRWRVATRSASRSGSVNSSSTITVGSSRIRAELFQKANSPANWSRRRACGVKIQVRPCPSCFSLGE